jgi:hypothetical protein
MFDASGWLFYTKLNLTHTAADRRYGRTEKRSAIIHMAARTELYSEVQILASFMAFFLSFRRLPLTLSSLLSSVPIYVFAGSFLHELLKI